jgi:hypothetical protein
MANPITMYTNFMIFFNIFRMTKPVNTALYLSNIFAFIGNFVIMVRNPYHLGFLVKDLEYINMIPLAVLHMLNHAWHLLPIVLFRKRQTLRETFSHTSFFIGTVLFLSYLWIFQREVLVENYDMSKEQMILMAFGTGAVMYVLSHAALRLK